MAFGRKVVLVRKEKEEIIVRAMSVVSNRDPLVGYGS